MGVSDHEKALAPQQSIDMENGDASSIDHDALKLAEMGYTQDMQRNFSVLSVLGVGFSLTNTWFGISAALVTGINSGGPLLVIYGVIIIFVVSISVGVTLSELASAMPNAGGQYFWANELAPKRYANIASYLTGWFAWAGAMFTSASVALAAGSAIVGSYQLTHPDL
jgi:choline transport protein